MKTYYLYYLIDPNTNEVRYVGITYRPKRRLTEHLYLSKKIKSHKDKWINKLLSNGQKPIFKIMLETESKDEILQYEISNISKLTNLTNLTTGGEYTTFTQNVIERFKKQNKGKNNPCYNKKWNENEITNLRLSKKNRKEVIINGIKYDSINQASQILHIRFYNARKFVTK